MSKTNMALDKYTKKLNNRRERYLEAARKNPVAYKRNIRVMAVISILVPAVFLLVIFGFLAFDLSSMLNENREPIFSVGAKIGIAAVVFTLFSALWVSTASTDDIEISPEQAPALFAMIEDVRSKVAGPVVDHVFISADLNASITQPNKGLKFWQSENHLTLGLPLLNMLTAEETKAVIAHEFGHFCAGDGKLGNILYRAAETTERLQYQYETEGASLFEIPLSFFVQHFGDRFVDRIFPLIREQEYAADAMAAMATSPQALSSALIRLQLGANYMGRIYWPAVTKNMFMSDVPNVRPIEDNMSSLCNVTNCPEGTRWINAGLLEENDYEDTHPVLSKRLQALGVQPFYPAHHNQPASQLLGHLYSDLSKQFDDDWQSKVQRAHAAPLDLDDAIELAEISNKLFEPSVLYNNMNYLLAQHANASEVWLYAGSKLLRDGQPQCIDYLQHAANLNSKMLTVAHNMMAQHYREMGNSAALKNLAA